MNIERNWLKKRILVPLATGTIGLLALFLYAFDSRVAETAHEQFVRDLQGIQTYWQLDMRHHVRELGGILRAITHTERLRDALERQCHRSLLEAADPLFHELNESHGISSLTFLSPRGRTLLRVHEPETYGDSIARFTAERAKITRQLASGWEFDATGELALRVVLPWYDGEKLLGYVELGEDTQHSLDDLDELFLVHHLVVVRKDYLRRIGFGDAEKLDDMTAGWDRFPEVVLLHQSVGKVPHRLEDILRSGNLAPLNDGLMVERDGRHYIAGVLPLFDSAAQAVGHIMTLRDITGPRAASYRAITAVNGIVLVASLGLFWFFYRITTRTEKELAKSYQELEDSHRQLAQAHREWIDSFNAIREPIFLHDNQFRVLRANHAYIQRAGMPIESITGRPYFEIFPKRDGPLPSCAKALQGQAGENEEEEIRLETGESFVSRSFFVCGDAGVYLYSVHILEDFTVHKQMQVALRNENRAYRTVSQSNQALIHAKDAAHLLRDICEIITNVGGYRLAWVGFKRDDPPRTIEPVGFSGIRREELRAEQLSWSEEEEHSTPSALAIRTGKLQIVRNAQCNPAFQHCSAAARRFGYASILALPLVDGDQTFGVLMICASAPDAFDDTEVTVLDELAGDLAYGTVALRIRTERERSERERLAALEELKSALNKTVQAMAAALEARDPYTAGHQRRVAKLAVAIATEMALPEEKINGIRIAGTLHDIGKIYVPAEILSKPGGLNAIERSLIETHPQVGHDILKDIDFPWPVAQMVLQHHEHLDGSGYPHGLTGDALLLETRILTVADVVESLLSHRPYRPTLGIDAALEEITKQRGKHYDPDVADACLALFRKKGFRLEAA